MRSAVIARELKLLCNGLLKQGPKTVRNAHLTVEERVCSGTLFRSTTFAEPCHIPMLLFSLEDAHDEIRNFGIDPATLIVSTVLPNNRRPHSGSRSTHAQPLLLAIQLHKLLRA